MSKKFTPWFPPEVKPVRVGVYQTDYEPFEDQPGYSYWDGVFWLKQYFDVKFARPDGHIGEQGKQWRGFTEKQDGPK